MPRPVWCAVFGAAVAITDPPGSAPPAVAVTAAVTAGLGAAAIVESGLDDWGGWSSGTVAAAIGAGVTAGLLLGLTGPRLRAAIGICATQAAGLRAAEGTDAFPLQAGKAAFNGVEAALLARARPDRARRANRRPPRPVRPVRRLARARASAGGSRDAESLIAPGFRHDGLRWVAAPGTQRPW